MATLTYSFKQVIADIRSRQPKITDEMALSYLGTVHRYLCMNFILSTQQFTINLVAGQFEYTLDPTITSVRTVNYVTAANNLPYILNPASTFDWDTENSSWRFDLPGIPAEFAVGEGKLSIWPPPNVSTSGGYPYLAVSAGVMLTLDPSQNIPWDVPPEVYIYGVLGYWAIDHCQQESQLRWQMFATQLDNLLAVLPKVSHGYRKQITPNNEFPAAI